MIGGDAAFSQQQKIGFQVSVSTLTLGTLYESILAFSGKSTLAEFWPAVCTNTRWIIPSRRLAILTYEGDEQIEIVARFERGSYSLPDQSNRLITCNWFEELLGSPNARWIENPMEAAEYAEKSLCNWLFKDPAEHLFLVPMRTRGETAGLMLFVTGETAESDKAMLNTLGTIYALHTGMTFEMIGITEEKRHLQEQMLLQEKMATLGNLAAGVAHEVNNPIGAVLGARDVIQRCTEKLKSLIESAESIETLRNNSKLAQFLEIIETNAAVTREAGERIAKIVKSLKSFAQLDEAEYQTIDIHEGIENTLTLLQREIPEHVVIVREFGELPRLHCNLGQLNQAFMHIMVNGLEAMHSTGTLHIKTYVEKNHIAVEISDSGVGIDPDLLEKVFEPGFSKKSVGVGVGLGLPISRNIVRDHGGDITMMSELGNGSTFKIKLPQLGQG